MKIKLASLWIFAVFGGGIILGWSLRSPGLAAAAALPAKDASSSKIETKGNSGTVTTTEDPEEANGKPRLQPWSELGTEARQRALELIFRIPDPAERLAQFLVRVRSFDRDDVLQSIRMIKNMDRQGVLLEREWESLIAQWGRLGGASALESTFAEFGADEKSLDWFSTKALRGWAEKDPQGAIRWLNAHEGHSDWPGAFLSLANGVGSTDPNLAAAMISSSLRQNEGKDAWVRKEAIKKLADQVSSSGGLESLRAWFEKIPVETDNGTTRRDAFDQVYLHIKHADKDAGKIFLETNAARPWRDDAVYAEYTTKLAVTSPQQALEWASSLPPSPQTGSWPAASRVYQQWLRQDPAAANHWLQAQTNPNFQQTLGAK
jgi:hypothetical protein